MHCYNVAKLDNRFGVNISTDYQVVVAARIDADIFSFDISCNDCLKWKAKSLTF